MAVIERKGDKYSFQNEIIAYQPHHALTHIYTLYMGFDDLNQFSQVLNQIARIGPEQFFLVPNEVPAKFANQATRGQLKELEERLVLVHNPVTGKVMIQLLVDDTQEYISDYATLYK